MPCFREVRDEQSHRFCVSQCGCMRRDTVGEAAVRVRRTNPTKLRNTFSEYSAMSRAIVFAYHNVGVAVVSRWAQPRCGHDEQDAYALFPGSAR
jgi:hypothetical protein